MTRAGQVCRVPGCGNLKPCGVAGHERVAWAGSRRAVLGRGGRKSQRKRARFVMARDGGVCHVCGQGGADQVDHVVALAAGGEDTVYNMAPIHSGECHREKTQREARGG